LLPAFPPPRRSSPIRRGRGAVPLLWTRDHLLLRLVDAFKTLRRMPSERGPKEFGNAWPVYEHDLADFNGRLDQTNEPALVKRIGSPRFQVSVFAARRRATAQQVSEAERMMDALHQYAQISQGVNVVQAEGRAAGQESSDDLAKRLGMSKASLFRVRNRVAANMASWMNRCGRDTF